MRASKEEIQNLYISGLTVKQIVEQTGVPNRSVTRYVKEVRELVKTTALKTREILKDEKIKTAQDTTFKKINLELKNAVLLIFGDAHIIPNQPLSAAASGLIKVAELIKPTHVFDMGDGFDFASISSHDAMGFENRFTIADEIRAVNEFLDTLRYASPKARHIMLTSNHNIRFNKILNKHLPQMKGVKMFSFEEQVPYWEHVLSIMINNEIILLHQFNGGVHSGYNNTLKGGISVVTGHTHQMEVKPFADYKGLRWGVQTGTLATIKDNPLFNYTIGAPLNWVSGFVVITIIDGVIQPPEQAVVGNDGKLFFRGKHIETKKID